MDRVLLTGGSGFVGRNLVAYLKNDYWIDNFSFRGKSLIDLEINAGTIIHLAGKAHDLKNHSAADEYYSVNYELTKDIYDAFLKSTAEKFIFISSVKAVADVVHGVLKEEHDPNPQTHYGKSKLLAEQYIQAQPLPEGKSYYILRPCMIHGPGNKGNLNLLYKFVKRGIPYPLAGFDNKRSFLSVENLCFVIKKLVEDTPPAGVYQVADDEPLSTNEVIAILSESIHRRAKLWRIPPSIINFIAKIGDRLKFPLNTERLNKLTENYVVSNQKIKAALDIQLPVTSREGLIVTALSFK